MNYIAYQTVRLCRAVQKGWLSGLCLAALILPAASRAQQTYTYVTNFTKNSNIQQNLIKQFPTGLWTATNGFATTFDIVTNSTGENFDAISSSLSVPVFISGASNVYTLMNAYTPGGGIVAIVKFYGDGGAIQTNNLQGGVNIRDFYQGSFVNSINNSTTENAYEILGVQDAGGTGNVNTGLTGDYVIDEQSYALGSAFLTQNLTNIVISYNGQGTPIVLGITVESFAPALAITNVVQIRGGISLAVSGVSSNETYVTFSSTNLALPFNQWLPLSTNTPDASGSLYVNVPGGLILSTPARFFVVEEQ